MGGLHQCQEKKRFCPSEKDLPEWGSSVFHHRNTPEVCLCVYVRTYVCMYACTQLRAHTHTHIYIYIYIYIVTCLRFPWLCRWHYCNNAIIQRLRNNLVMRHYGSPSVTQQCQQVLHARMKQM
jgi:hypothetical protein